MNEEELKKDIEEIREEQKILCRRYSSEEEDDNLIMKDQRRLDKGYNKRINQILKERSSWYNIALEVDEILIILLKARLEGFQKGKLEQKKEDNIRFMYSLDDLTYIITNWGVKNDFPLLDEIFSKIGELKEQLQKEIGGNSQQPRMKQTRGGELKSDEGLHSTDNGSPADIVSKEDSEDICICGHHTKDHSYDPNKLDCKLECDICNCMEFKTKEDRSFLDGYAEFWDNPEDDRWDKEEEKQDE